MMRAIDILLALGMLVAGTINTIASKYQDTFEVVGIHGKGKHQFDHPAIQTFSMFLGETLCLVAFFVLRTTERKSTGYQPIGENSKGRNFPLWLFAIPAMCDMTGSTLMYIGLSLTYPSVYQMIRGMIVVFTGLFSWWFLKTKLYGFHILGMLLIVAGTAIVGVSSVLSKHDTGAKNPLLGDVFVIIAQLAAATQMVVEEKFVGKYDVPPLQVVGNEGAWGACVTALILFILYWIPPVRKIDNSVDGILQIIHGPWLLVAILGSIFSIAFFNFFGISVTKNLSATHRTTVDATRVFLVWLFSLIIGWEKFQWLQLIGFIVLLIGTATFNELFRLPGFYYPPKDIPPASYTVNQDGESDYMKK